MPCFLGLAVSIHTPSGPLPEHSIQRQSKFHRITSYIPVPPAKVPEGSAGRPEQSTFAISITLLTPGLNVPYSAPKPTADDPNPRPQMVAGPPASSPRDRHAQHTIAAYKPLTMSPNETIAAYIYFDGRAKEEVATLLRRGEETWVNSRWVSVPESEGGGLAEREFLFREVGLERWLNGLDLEGKDVAARIERRKQRLEKKRRKRIEAKNSDDDDEKPAADLSRKGVLRYGENTVEPAEGNEDFFTSDEDSEDDKPVPEAAGQIKVALFRVLASGEIKRGEYSPQFGAHDDDENAQNGGGEGEDIDHTTSFAKPKTLDPKSISTQTVTGIDPPDKPYAVFTFLYRGERQLRKMGILTPDKPQPTPVASRRKSTGLNFGELKPLNAPPANPKKFTGYRDPTAASPFKAKRRDDNAMDSDADDEDDTKIKAEDMEDERDESSIGPLSAEDVLRQRELAEGLRKIKLKRQHSAEPVNRVSDDSPTAGSPVLGAPFANAESSTAGAASGEFFSVKSAVPAELSTEGTVGSPFKKHRASLHGLESAKKSLVGALLGAKRTSKTSSNSSSGGSPANETIGEEQEIKMEDDDL